MANHVYANGREISCKKANGKSICCFPDVCFTPPENPTTPPGVPIPYPNTAFAKDTTSGSKTVKITNQEIILKNKSYFKTSVGNEAGSTAKKGFISNKIKGKAHFVAWSMNVKVEGKNVARHLDMTTHNHGSTTNTAPWLYADRMAMILASSDDCPDEIKRINKHCGKSKAKFSKQAACPPLDDLDTAKVTYAANKSAANKAALREKKREYAKTIRKNKCQKALRCALVPYRKNSKSLCCPPQTPDHLIPASMFFKKKRGGALLDGCGDYNDHGAPCMCAIGGKSEAVHGLLGKKRKKIITEKHSGKKTWTLDDAADCGAQSANEVNPQCSKKCIKDQLLKQHKAMGDGGLDENTVIKTKHENVRRDLSEFEKDFSSLIT